MNSRWIESFVAAVEAGSISKAAEGLFISPQALTQQVNLLERELGLKLLERTTRGVSPTVAGTRFLDGMQRMTELWDATLTRCREAPEHVRTWITPACAAFPALDAEAARREYQQVKALDEPDLKFVLNDDYKNWLKGLRDGAYDFIRYVRVGNVHPLGMYFEPVRELTAWCLMPPTHPLAGKEVVEPEDLAGLRVTTSDARVIRRLLDIMEAQGLAMDLWETPVSRMHILEALDGGSVCIFSKNFVRDFEGYPFAPVNCPIDNWEGLLCRAERQEELARVFAIFHRHLAAHEL